MVLRAQIANYLIFTFRAYVRDSKFELTGLEWRMQTVFENLDGVP